MRFNNVHGTSIQIKTVDKGVLANAETSVQFATSVCATIVINMTMATMETSNIQCSSVYVNWERAYVSMRAIVAHLRCGCIMSSYSCRYCRCDRVLLSLFFFLLRQKTFSPECEKYYWFVLRSAHRHISHIASRCTVEEDNARITRSLSLFLQQQENCSSRLNAGHWRRFMPPSPPPPPPLPPWSIPTCYLILYLVSLPVCVCVCVAEYLCVLCQRSCLSFPLSPCASRLRNVAYCSFL